MEWSRHVRIIPVQTRGPSHQPAAAAVVPSYHRLAAPLRRAIMRTRQWLLGRQQDDGHWVGELEGDSILQSEFILLLAFLKEEHSPAAKKAAHCLAGQQLEEGGWAMIPGGKVDVSASVKAYFALKLTGRDPADEEMQRARSAILAHGGADAVNSFTRFYLALLGQISYDHCPAVVPEMILLPRWFPVNLARVSAWTRTIIVPLSIMWAHRPVRRIDPARGIRELFLRRPDEWPALRSPGVKGSRRLVSWERVFRALDHGLKWLEKLRLVPLRKRAFRAAEKWMIERFEGSDGLGAIFPPMVWSVVALKCLGHEDDSPQMQYCRRQLEGLMIEEDDTLRLQPCKSPVWDTANTLRALSDSGIRPTEEAIRRATDWLLDREIRTPGDWSAAVKARPSGWCFEYANDFYPDVDDTAMVLMALGEQLDQFDDAELTLAGSDSLPPGLHVVGETQLAGVDEARCHVAGVDRLAAAVQRGSAWLLAMQNRDGGWGAFDKDNDRRFLCHVPFADHNAMIDPSTADLTGRVLESLGRLGHRVGQSGARRGPVDRAVAYLRRSQQADGSWFGRWGVNYIYGTWQVLVGLNKVGVDREDPMIVAAANWLLAHQQTCGGWGETADSYDAPMLRGQGPPTASQTAWAVMGLMAAGMHRHPAVARGVRYLLGEQQADGTWDEPQFTGTGFPRVFYLRYHMYPIYFPLMAISRYAVAIGAQLEEADQIAQQLADTAAGLEG